MSDARGIGWKQVGAGGLAAGAWFAVFSPWWNGFHLLPVALAMSLLCLRADLTALRLTSAGLAVVCWLWALCMTIASYPYVVIADSDLGIDATNLVSDYSVLSKFTLVLCIALGIAAMAPWNVARLAAVAAPLVVACGVSFRSSNPPVHAWRMILVVLGVAAATELWAIGLSWLPAFRSRWR